MWTMMVILVATNIVVSEQKVADEATCRAAAYEILVPGVTYIDCHPSPDRPDNGMYRVVDGFTVSEHQPD